MRISVYARVLLPSWPGLARTSISREGFPVSLRHGRGLSALVPLIVALLSGLMVAPGSAQAQGILDFIFGSAAKKQAPAPRPRALPRSSYSNYNFNARRPAMSYRPLARGRWQRAARSDGNSDRRTRSGGFRTVCVRSCDGYYFPISFAVRRSQFARDARVCQSKCGGEAKLYYMPSQAEPKTLLDMRGLPYAKTKTAFLFRKARVKGCSCRPQPWQPSEIFRHKLYELNEAPQRKLARLEGDTDFLSGTTKKRRAVIEAEAAAIRLAGKLSGGAELGAGPQGITTQARSRAGIEGAVGHAAAVLAAWAPPRFARPERNRPLRILAKTSPAREDDPAKAWTRRGLYSRNYAQRGNTRGAIPSHRPKPVGRPSAVKLARRKPPAASAATSFFGLPAKPKYRWPGD